MRKNHLTAVLRALPSVMFGFAALAVTGMSLWLCVYADGHQAQVEDSGPGSPEETIQLFFDALSSGDWADADALLEEGNTLGLAQGPANPVSAAFWDAQCRS